MERVVRVFPVLLGGVLAALFFVGRVAAAGPPVMMIDPQWQQQRDSQGVFWTVDHQSNLRLSGQTMLMSAGVATINNAQFMPGRAQMRADGTEFVFEGNNNFNNVPSYGPPNGAFPQPLLTVRRIKMDLQSSTARFVESFQNTGPAPLQVHVTVGSTVRTMIQSVVCGPSGKALDVSTGQPTALSADERARLREELARSVAAGQPIGAPFRPAGGGIVHLAIPDHDCGIVVNAQPGRYPGLMLYFPESVNAKPSIDIQGMRTIQVSYNLTVPAQSTASVVWGLVQSNLQGNLDAAEIKKQLKVFQDRQWLSDLPENVTKSIVNNRAFNPGVNSPLALLQPVLELASQYHLERGAADVLVQDEQTQLQGIAAGSDLAVETTLGKTSVPLAKVALLYGAAGGDRPMRVYLRSGEILAGRVEAKDLMLRTQAGVEAKMSPEKINLLFLHAARSDGKPIAAAESILETNDGQRLLVTGSNTQFHTVTPWGGLDVGLGEIDRLNARRETQPVYRLDLKDGSSLTVLLEGGIPPLQSLRFGPVQLPAAGVRQLWSIKMPPPAKDAAGNESSEKIAEEEASGPSGPQCRLFGDNVIAGTIESPKVILAMAGGVLAFPADGIQTAKRSGDPRAGGPMEVQLTDGRHLSGVLSNRTVAIRFHGKVWEVPAQHLIEIRGGKKESAAEESPEDEASSESAAGRPGAAKAGTTEDDDAPEFVPPPAKPAPAAPTLSAPVVPRIYIPGSVRRSGFNVPPPVAPAPPERTMPGARPPGSPVIPTTDNDDDPFQ